VSSLPQLRGRVLECCSAWYFYHIDCIATVTTILALLYSIQRANHEALKHYCRRMPTTIEFCLSGRNKVRVYFNTAPLNIATIATTLVDHHQRMSSLSQALRCRKPVIQRGIIWQCFSTGPELQDVVESAAPIRVRPKASNVAFSKLSSWRKPEKQQTNKRKVFPPRPVYKETIPPKHFGRKTVARRPVAHHPQHEPLPERVKLPTSSWIQLRDVPPLATLDDVCSSVGLVLDIERKIGIRDLESVDGRCINPSTPWVKGAKTLLSTHGRPTHWAIELENRSIVNAFLEHAKEAKFMCVWKEVSVSEWNSDKRAIPFEVNDSMIRVENCPSTMTADILRHVFRRYDFARSGTSIFRWDEPNTSSVHNMFVICFADASYARAAVREMQGLRIGDKELKIAQYPKQLI
jgi:hypothetical protein